MVSSNQYIDYNSLSDTVRIPNNQYFGNYRGTVLNNDDTEYHRGRCKIYVRGVYPERYTENKGEKLPWAEPCQPLFCGGMRTDGTFQCPDIGSTCWVFFEGGDIARPVFFGQTTDKAGYFDIEHCNMKWQDMEIDLHKNYKDMTSTISISAKTTINETAVDKDINREAGNNINDHAKIIINITGDQEVNITGGKHIKITSPSIDILGDSEINMSAPSITIKAGSSLTINGSVANITGGSGDCVILGKSLVNHTHPVPPHCPGPGMTMPPV